jgi:hypothetical protein
MCATVAAYAYESVSNKAILAGTAEKSIAAVQINVEVRM